MRSASDPHPRRARLCAVKSAVLLFFVLGATAWRLDGASFVIDFRQGSNQNPNLGQEVWINGILNTGNSEYFEGMVIPQRVIMLNVPATAGNVHHLTFHTDATKGGIHAFDFLASYPQTVETTNAIDPYFKTHPHMTAAGLNPCGPNIGPPNTMAATCAALRGVDNGSGYGANAVLIAPPSDPYVSKDGSTQSKINAFESAFPNGQLAIYGNAAVTNASITVVNHTTSGGTVAIANGTDTSDTTIHYDLTWTSASDEILFEFGAHLSVSGKDATGYNWGPGLGAAFISGGSYHVSLDALDAGTPTSISLGSQDNQIMANAVTLPPPSCGITGPDATCANTTGLTYSASSDGSSPTYVWSITGNGTINGSNTNSSVTVDAGSSGTFTISVSISDIGGSTSCSKTVTVNANPTPTATGGAACIGGSVTLTASSGFASYSWVGPSGFSSTAQNPTISNVSALNAGTYSVTVTDANGCSGSASATVVVNGNPVPTATGGSACAGGSVTLTASSGFASYSWVGPSGFTSTAQNPQLTNLQAANAGTYTVTVTDGNTCTGSASATVTVNGNPVPTATGGSACAGGSVTLTASSGFASYSWVGPSGFTSTAQNPQLTNLQAANAGTYTVTVTDANKCTGSASATVTVNGNPVPSANGGSACVGGSVTLTASSGFASYSWVGPSGFTSTAQNPQLTNLQAANAGTYTVTVTDGNACTGSASTTVAVNDNPTPSATGGTACTGGSVTLTATGGFTTYSWVGPNSFTSTDQNPQLTNLTANDAGTYTVTVTDSNGCTGSASATVTVTACEEFCTVTPGFWGSAAGSQGKFDGITASNLLNCLMAGNPVVLGVYGIRSLTIDDPACVIERFPSSGTPTALPDFGKFGAPDRTISTATSCETTQPQIPLNNNGRFKNILLGETATLILNLRDDPALGGYVLPATISTVPANPGPDGIVGEPLTCVSSLTNDDSANFGIGCNTITRTVPAGLVGLTVNQLLTLANQALAGLTTGFTYSDINQAVTAINEGFDQCRFLGSCPSSTLTADPVPAEADR